MTWDVPVADVCPECNKTMFKPSGRGSRKPFCANPECVCFLPEDKRGYRKKAEASAADGENAEKANVKDVDASSIAAKKNTSSIKAASVKKTSPVKKVSSTKKTASAKKNPSESNTGRSGSGTRKSRDSKSAKGEDK